MERWDQNRRLALMTLTLVGPPTTMVRGWSEGYGWGGGEKREGIERGRGSGGGGRETVAVERWDQNRRLALKTLTFAGLQPRW